jgi:hypothetical protein
MKEPAQWQCSSLRHSSLSSQRHRIRPHLAGIPVARVVPILWLEPKKWNDLEYFVVDVCHSSQPESTV